MRGISSRLASRLVFASAGLFLTALSFASTAVAQRTAASIAAAQSKAIAEGRNNSGYDASKEVSLQGTVAKFTENSTSAPAGAHILLQTASGQVDVHLGDARILKLNSLAISEGSNVRIVGEPVTTNQGTFFLARLVQQGTQVVAMRSATGAAVVFSGNRGKTTVQSSTQGGPR